MGEENLLNIDFSKIRNHDGSQDNGFEELICQLAHLSPPDNADYFVRKDGAGGDAGVECYWKLTDGSEHAWQAKYFLGSLGTPQWKQISESVESALAKHPNLTKYYVCLPRDWNDSRKIGSGGTTINSNWDKWVEHVEKWSELSKEKGMNVQFTYWCKHEISLMLQTTDNPLYAGKALYWFNEPVIQHELLEKIAQKSRNSLGERFTPDYHIDLPIAQHFDGLGITPEWENSLKKHQKVSNELVTELITTFFKQTNTFNSQACWIKLRDKIINLNEKFDNSLRKNTFLQNHLDLLKMTYEAEKLTVECSISLYNQMTEMQEKHQREQYEELYRILLQRITAHLFTLKEFYRGPTVEIASAKVAILLGEAGIGKSHLLCDIALKRLNIGLPTLFILGQHYPGGDPMEFIKKSLELKGFSTQQVLGALNAAAEAKNSRTLIIIDAINEGKNRHDWYDNISSFLTELSYYPNISIAFSCRSTYKVYILPDLSEHELVNLYHSGFKGYEHRAASKYLSKQGISKPSAPITSPEFSNPLFLKTCCKALKSNNLTSFPKGMHGQSAIFQFYTNSIEKTIKRIKRYLPLENVVPKVIDTFVESLFPEYLDGMPIDMAREIIDSKDPKPQIGESLTNLLVDEGIFSFDVIPGPNGETRGTEVLRFTYERFCDYFIAQHIVKNYVNPDDITDSFSQEGFIGKIIYSPNLYRFGGIIEALGLCIPENFKHEFIDFIPKDSPNYDWLFTKSFSDVIVLRSPDSFTEKSIELLNQIPIYEFNNKRLDILLSLSTEPMHPWNADFLDEKLMSMTLSDRDIFWSTHLAVSDWEEDEEQGESIVRTLIEWSLSANLDNVETERLRLITIILTWMTTTSNRKVRDQSTKSLARILSHAPNLISLLIEQYKNANDPYLIERLYAAIYGAVCNIKDSEIIKDIAELVFNYMFKNGHPYSHILVRDYARGVLELAYNKGILKSEITPNAFRPPYKSDWPIPNPSNKEIDDLAEGKFSSIKNSVLGSFGDFGIYSMNCVPNWSPTVLSEEKPESSYEVHLKFANSLPEYLKDKYLSLLNKELEDTKHDNFDLIEFLERIKSNGISLDDILQDLDDVEDYDLNELEDLDGANEPQENINEWEELTKEIRTILNEEQNEHFRWLNSLGINDQPATFSKEWAQRWVCKRAYELGWNPNIFEEFERKYTRSTSRMPSIIERIGKKYQWIAFHELLAKMSDNLHWIARNYNDVDNSNFFGPWQIYIRDLDPTMWRRSTGDSGWNDSESAWWQPYAFPFVSDDLNDQKSWLWNEEIIPPFTELLERINPLDNKKWTVLKGFAKWSKIPEKDVDIIPKQDAWFRINSCIVHKKDVEKLKTELKEKNLCDPYILNPGSTGHQSFMREFPWHPSYKTLNDWIDPNSKEYWNNLIKVKHLVPINQYEWESGSTDQSIDDSISLYLPNKHLINELDISLKPYETGIWLDSKENPAFIDPSANTTGPSYALIRSDLLEQWLAKSDLQLVWIIGGEKYLFTNMAQKSYGKLIFSGIYTISNNNLEGEMCFIKEPGDVED